MPPEPHLELTCTTSTRIDLFKAGEDALSSVHTPPVHLLL